MAELYRGILIDLCPHCPHCSHGVTLQIEWISNKSDLNDRLQTKSLTTSLIILSFFSELVAPPLMKPQGQSSVWSRLWTNPTVPSSSCARSTPRRPAPGPRRRPSSLPCSGRPPALPPARFPWPSSRSPPRSGPAPDPMLSARRLTPAALITRGRSSSYSRVCEKLEIHQL